MSQRPMRTVDGAERLIDDFVIDDFASGLHGHVLRPSDPAYEAARRVWNGMVDKRPALIARPIDTAGVVTCVRFAREHDLLVSVRGGGHNYAGKSVCEGGLMIDLGQMKSIHVDPKRQTARAQAGVRLGEFDCETQRFGLATTLGMNTDTGIAGLTLGGGYGWLNGKHGLACDNLLSVEMVTADGRVVIASAEENEDLYWAVRGAGANFGIVTWFEYRLHRLGPVFGGMVLYPLGPEPLRVFDDFSATCADEVSTTGLLVTAPNGEKAVAIAVCHSGEIDRAEKDLEPIRTFARPLVDSVAPLPYPQMQMLLDEAWPPGRRYYQKSSIVRRLTAPAVEMLVELARTLPTPVSAVAFQQLHGAASRVRPTETAFPHRFDHYSAYVHPATDDPAESDAIVRWGRDAWQALLAFTELAVYVNALEDAVEEGESRVGEAYGANHARLATLKKKYDPTNFFASNANVKPAEPR